MTSECLFISIYLSTYLGASQVVLVGKNPPASGGNPWRRAWQLTPVFLLEEFHRQRSLVHRVTNSWTQLKRLSMHVRSILSMQVACTKASICLSFHLSSAIYLSTSGRINISFIWWSFLVGRILKIIFIFTFLFSHI